MKSLPAFCARCPARSLAVVSLGPSSGGYRPPGTEAAAISSLIIRFQYWFIVSLKEDRGVIIE